MAQTISKMETVQTAIEWLIEQLEQQVYTIDHKDNRVIPKSFDDIVEIKKQAKQMEKEQIINTYLNACARVTPYGYYNDSAEQYYNETYGSNN